MFFIKVGSFIAWTLVVLGFFKAALGLFGALTLESQENMIAFSKRYLATDSTGEAMDRGIMMFAAGIVLGLIVRIAKKSQATR